MKITLSLIMSLFVIGFFIFKINGCGQERKLRQAAVEEQERAKEVEERRKEKGKKTSSKPSPTLLAPKTLPTTSTSLSGGQKLVEKEKVADPDHLAIPGDDDEEKAKEDQTPPPPAQSSPGAPTHIEIKGLQYTGVEMGTDGVLRNCYDFIKGQDMEFIEKHKDVKGLLIECDGPVIYEGTTANYKAIQDKDIIKPFKIKKSPRPEDKGYWWDYTSQSWGELKPFKYGEIENISSIRVLKDPDDLAGITVKIGIPVEVVEVK